MRGNGWGERVSLDLHETSTGLQEIAGWVREAGTVVALAGAGISTESGIPDFRGPNGVWTKDPKAEKLASLEHYMSDPHVRARAWQMRLHHPALTARPNRAHQVLAGLESKGKLDTLITQNIDGLHLAAGSSPERLIEIHGSMREVVCMSCGSRSPMASALVRVRSGEPDPSCESCGGILKSATISFGQSLVRADLERARRAANGCDLFLAIGTSLSVYPVAYLPRLALASGARVVIFNAEPTPLDPFVDALVGGSVGTSLSALAALL
ncbi:MAG: NAD-dependent deacetylase [Actinomycetota bacterium]|nr:NAD-dependent deacetylase [Actinomycetota bacterium]